MYTYHLWIKLAETSEESDAGGLSTKITALQQYIHQRIPVRYPENPIHQANYVWVLQYTVQHNHRSNSHQELLGLLEWIGHNLPGSHGLVYWHDDEVDDLQARNNYNVLVMVRGNITSYSDPYFSPRNPVVED